MPEFIHEKKIFTLYEVTQSIQRTLTDRYSSSFWVKAEMNKLNFYRYTGHCYPELVEKQAGKVIAQLRAILWKEDYLRINNQFLDILQEPLKEGIKILFLAKITYDSVYGLSLRILDIDPTYTLGDLEAEKMRAIQKLQSIGIFSQNKRLQIPILPQRIAVISVETSKGYADFLNVLEHNSWGYAFSMTLFPAVLQGERAIADITSQILRIQKLKENFDIIAIVRGGGSDIGLSIFNHFNLAQVIALCPIPIFTGIGHSTNETVAEMVAFHNAITPTKLAEFLIQQFHNAAIPLQKITEKLALISKRKIQETYSVFYLHTQNFQNLTQNKLFQANTEISHIRKQLHKTCLFVLDKSNNHLKNVPPKILFFKNALFNLLRQNLQNLQNNTEKEIQQGLQKHGNELVVITKHFNFVFNTTIRAQRKQQNELFLRLNSAVRTLFKEKERSISEVEKLVIWSDPVQILKKGFSLTLKNGRIVSSISQLNPNDEIQTVLADGTLISVVREIQQLENE